MKVKIGLYWSDSPLVPYIVVERPVIDGMVCANPGSQRQHRIYVKVAPLCQSIGAIQMVDLADYETKRLGGK